MKNSTVKEVNMIGNNVRETIFTDDSVVYEEIKEAVLASGVKRTLEASSTGTVSYAMDVTMDVNGEDKTFSALIYQDLKDSDKLEEGTFDVGAKVNVAFSRAKDKNGEFKTYARIELPSIVAADDFIGLDSMSPEFRERLEQLENASDMAEMEATDKTTSAKDFVSNEVGNIVERSDFYDNSKDDDSYSDSNLEDDFGLDTQNKTSKYRDGPLLVMMVIAFIGIILILQPLYHVFGEFLYVIAVFATVGAIKLIEPLFKKQ